MSATRTYLAEITREARKLGIDLEGNMFPGATADEILETTKNLPFGLPQEVIELFLWHNGVRLEGQLCEFRFFPRLLLQPIEASVETTRILISPSDDPCERWHKSWYSLFTDLAGDYYAIDTDQDSQNYSRIFAVKEALDPYPAFWSLEVMLQSILECYRAHAYFLDENELLAEDHDVSEPIYRMLNRELSPHKFESKGTLKLQVRRAKQTFERERRPDLLLKLQELAEKSGLDFDEL